MNSIARFIKEIDISVCKLYLIEHISDISNAEIARLLAFIPSWRRDEVLTFRHEGRKRESILSFILLMFVLQREYGITEILEFDYLEHGKPILPTHPEIFFNMSDCREAVACATGRKSVGVDVEQRGKYKELLARKVLNNEEILQVLQSKDADLEFTKLWTRKEAVLKLTGEGVSMNMKNVISNHAEITLSTYERGSYVCSVAYLQ